MKTLCLCIALLMCAPGVASAAERDTLTVLLIGDSTTKGATPRRVKPDGIHLEEMIEKVKQVLHPEGCIVFNSVSDESKALLEEAVRQTGLRISAQTRITIDDFNTITVNVIYKL